MSHWFVPKSCAILWNTYVCSSKFIFLGWPKVGKESSWKVTVPPWARDLLQTTKSYVMMNIAIKFAVLLFVSACIRVLNQYRSILKNPTFVCITCVVDLFDKMRKRISFIPIAIDEAASSWKLLNISNCAHHSTHETDEHIWIPARTCRNFLNKSRSVLDVPLCCWACLHLCKYCIFCCYEKWCMHKVSWNNWTCLHFVCPLLDGNMKIILIGNSIVDKYVWKPCQ